MAALITKLQSNPFPVSNVDLGIVSNSSATDVAGCPMNILWNFVPPLVMRARGIPTPQQLPEIEWAKAEMQARELFA